MQSTDALLINRYKTHGEYYSNARVAQSLKNKLRNGDNWARLEDIHREALDFIAGKLARIVNGDPNFVDHWEDIMGYCKLVLDRVQPSDKEVTLRAINKLQQPKDLMPPAYPSSPPIFVGGRTAD